MSYFVVRFLICGEKHFRRYDMHIIVGFTKLPEAVRHTVYGADVILVFVEWGCFGGRHFYLSPNARAQPVLQCSIEISIDISAPLTSKIKGHVVYLNISVRRIVGIDVLCII